MLRFAHEDYLYALIAIPFFLVLFVLMIRWRNKSLKNFGDVTLVMKLIPDVSGVKLWMKFILLTLAFAFLVVGIADPQIGTKLEEVKREGVDVMVALDVSNSMKAEDIRPSRMERAKQVISKLIDHLQNDRIGIIAFAGKAFVQLPITSDFGAAKLFLSGIDTDIISTQGTAIGSAIDLAAQSMDMKDKKHKVLIIITDGENHEDDAVDAAKKARKDGIVVHTIGMGSPEGAPIPVYRNNTRVDFLKDNEGKTVVTKLDESALRKIAKAGDGIFIRANNSDDGLKAILQEISQMEKKNYGSKMFTDYEDRFQEFLGIALLLLLIEGIISRKKNKWMQRANIFKTTNKSMPVSLFLIVSFAGLFVLLSMGNAKAQSEKKIIREGNKEYKNKKYSEAEINYRKALEKNKESKDAVYNLGDALYRQGKYEEAASQFQQITSGNGSNELKAKAYHNLGNSYLKMKKLEESVSAYKNALKLSPGDMETKYNLAYAQSLLKQQQQQQQQNKNDKQQNKDQQNKDQQKQDQQKQDQQKNDSQNKEKKEGNENKDEQGKQEKQPQKLSKEEAQRILDALNRKEKDMHKKLDKKESGNSNIEKNW